jgi:hypothetical protein
MSFNATINLGVVGRSITGETVSISGCTGINSSSECTGCTSVSTSQLVSSFPKLITGFQDNHTYAHVEVISGDCVGESQCIIINNIPTPTSTPAPSPSSTPPVTPTSTPPGTPTPSLGPVIFYCGSTPYDPNTHGCCSNNNIYNLSTEDCCGNLAYNTSTSYCCSGIVICDTGVPCTYNTFTDSYECQLI